MGNSERYSILTNTCGKLNCFLLKCVALQPQPKYMNKIPKQLRLSIRF